MNPVTTWPRVRSWRARRHFLRGAPATTAAEVADRLLGVQAQVTSSAEQAVAVRGPDGGLRAGLADGGLVRTWAARGTLHVLSAEQAPAVLALLAAARTWEKGSWQREFATAAEIERLAELVVGILPGRSLTRDELVAELDEHVGPELAAKLASGWGTLLKPLAWRGLLVNGEMRGPRPTFTAPGWDGLPGADPAAHAIVPAYLGAHGPATPEAFDDWLLRGGTKRATLRRWFAELTEAGVLAPVDVRDAAGDTVTLHARATDLDALVEGPEDDDEDDVRLLPAFDQWILGPGTKDPHVVPPERRREISRAAGWIAPVVLRGARVVGTWSVDDAEVTLFPGESPLPAAGLQAELDRWAPWRATAP